MAVMITQNAAYSTAPDLLQPATRLSIGAASARSLSSPRRWCCRVT